MAFNVRSAGTFHREFQHLSCWYFYCSLNVELSAESEETPSDEVIEERLIHSLSREYIEMLGK